MSKLLRRSLIAVSAVLSLAACAIGPVEKSNLTPKQLANQKQSASLYGLFLAGQAALNDGKGLDAEDYFARAAKIDSTAGFLKERAFTAALVAGDVPRAAELAPGAGEGSAGTRRLGKLTKAIELMAQGRGKEASWLLNGDSIGSPHEAAVALLRPWAAAMSGDQKAALTLPDDQGDKLIQYFGGLDRALLLERAGRTLEAEAGFRALLQGGEGGGLFTIAYGGFLERQGRRTDAKALYEAALKGDPENRAMLTARDRVVKDEGPPAAPTLRQAAAQALLAPAANMLAQKHPEMGLAYLRLVLRLDPSRDEAWLLVGDTMTVAGDVEAARAAYAKPEPGSSQYVEARTRLTWTYQEVGDGPMALKLARETADAAPKDADALTMLADVLRNNDKYDESAKVLDGLIGGEGAKPDWRLYYMRGVAFERAGRWADAERDLKQALAMKPDDPEVQNYLGYSWIERGEHLADAKAMIEKAVSTQPNSGAMIDSLGWAYFRLGDYDQAVEQLEHAVELEPADADVNNHLGDAYWRVGRKTEAEYQWQRVLTLEPSDKLKTEVEVKLKAGLDGAPSDQTARVARK